MRRVIRFGTIKVDDMKWRTNIPIIAVLLVTYCTTIDGISLDCLYETANFIDIGNVYVCSARALFDENVNVTSVSGNHQRGKAHRDVRGLVLQSQNLDYFPTNVESFFPNIIGIFFYNNSITTVSNRHLIPFPNLQVLWLEKNNISSIDGDLFSGLDAIKVIQFSDNNIRHVGHDLHLPINGEVYFRGNPCIDANGYTPDTVASLKVDLFHYCPPAQIVDSSSSTCIDCQVQSLIENAGGMNDELRTLRNKTNDELAKLRNEQVNLLNRIAYLELINERKYEPTIDVRTYVSETFN